MRYSLPLLGARVTFVSGQNLGKIILGKLFEPIQLGYFSFAFQTVERFVELVHTVPLALLPSFTQLEARGQRARLEEVFAHAQRLIGVVACALSFGLFLFAREITLLVGSPLFEPAIPLLRILALVPMARTAQQPFTMMFQALRMPGLVFRLALIKFGTELVAYFTLVPTIGMIGAGFANLSGAVASYIAAFVLLARLMPDAAPARWRTLFSTLVVFLPLMTAGLLIEARVAAPWSLVLRLLLIPIAMFGILALRLVNRYDLDRLSSIPLESSWMRRVRDVLVGAAVGVMRAVEPRGAAS
jgi:O-antigen/teichoic acid export membrane protein